jgi:ACT domain-containing protein
MHVITENEIRDVAGRIETGGTFTVPADTLLTPLARDYLHSRGVNIADQNSRHAPRAKPAHDAKSDDALVDAVADEVSRILREQPESKSSAPEIAAAAVARAKRSGEGGASNRAVVWAIGGDRPGILAAVAELLGRRNANILEINQTILSGVFAMVVIIDLQQVKEPFAEFKTELEALGSKLGITVSAQRDEIFQYMHRV